MKIQKYFKQYFESLENIQIFVQSIETIQKTKTKCPAN